MLVRVHHDVGGVEEPWFRQPRNRAPAPVGGEDGISEGCLVQPCLDLPKRIATLWRGWEVA